MKKLQITFLALLLTGTIFSCREKEEEFIKTTNPEVSITNYQGGETVHSIITLEIEATDTEGVEKVEVYVNGDLAETLTSQPYAFEINTFSYEDGPLQIKVEAHDAYGNKGMVKRALIVDNVLLTFSTLNLNRRFEGVAFNEDVYYYLVITGDKEGEETILFETDLDDFKEYVIRRPEWYHEEHYNYVYGIRRVREGIISTQFTSDNLYITNYPKTKAKFRQLGSQPSTGGATPRETIGSIVVTYSPELQQQIARGIRTWAENFTSISARTVDGQRYDQIDLHTETSEVIVNLGLADDDFREHIGVHAIGDTVVLDFNNTELLDKRTIEVGSSNNWFMTQFRAVISGSSVLSRGTIHSANRIQSTDPTKMVLPISKKVEYNYLTFNLSENNITYRSNNTTQTLPSSMERLSPDYQLNTIGEGVFEFQTPSDFTYATLTERAGTTNNFVYLYHIVDKDASGKYEVKRPCFLRN